MKKKLFALLVPFCCCAIAPLCAQTEEDEVVSSTEISTIDDATTVESQASALFKKGCGCGTKPKA